MTLIDYDTKSIYMYNFAIGEKKVLVKLKPHSPVYKGLHFHVLTNILDLIFSPAGKQKERN